MTSTEKSSTCAQKGQGVDVSVPDGTIDPMSGTAVPTAPGGPVDRPTWQTQPCPPWCTWAPHGEDELPEDRHHTSTTYKRNLALERPVKAGPGEDSWEPEYVGTYLWQHVREAEPTITLCKGESNEGFRLTLDDAEVLAELLRSLVEEGRGSGATTPPEPDPAPAAEDKDRFVVPRKTEQGIEHPQWCEVRRFCDVGPLPSTTWTSGWHRDEPEVYRGEDDTRLAYELSAGAFHDTDGAIDRPNVAIRVVEADMVDSFVEGSLTPDEARALAALLVKVADHAATLAERYV